ncbi:MAG: PilZ domain-containing protein, partial [Thermodesulfovibrionales bacterium]
MAGKRRHKRIIKRLKTEFSSEDSSFRGTSSNLSESGLFLKTIKPLPVDTLVEVSIQLPDNTVSKLKGTVRWSLKAMQRTSSRSGMGIEIIENDRHYVDFLNTLLPPEEQILFKEHKKVVPAPPAAKVEHIAAQKSRPVSPPKSPPAATRKSYSETKDSETKDNEIDS